MTDKRPAPPADERGSIAVAMLIAIVAMTLAAGMLASAAGTSAAVRAASMRAASLNSASSLRSQIVGDLNASVPGSFFGDWAHLAAGTSTGCGPASAPMGLALAGCASITLQARDPAGPADPLGLLAPSGPVALDEAAGYRNAHIDISVQTWQRGGPASAPAADGARLGAAATSFQAYGTCVSGYVPGTGAGGTGGIQYTPCNSATPAASRYMVWAAKNLGG